MDQNSILTHEETLFIEEALGKPDGVIAFPTDTVYGLGCLLEHEMAVKKIYDIKGREKEKPLIILGSSLNAMEKYLKYVPDVAMKLAKKYWPGALTIVLPKSRLVPPYINANLETIGIRVPKNTILLELLKRCVQNHVLATTSANYSNQPELVLYEDVKKVLGDKVDYLVEDNNPLSSGVPSTIISISKDNNIKILRQGSVLIEL